MSGDLTPQAKDIALKAMFGSACQIGLTRDGVEIADPGYQRQAAVFDGPIGGDETQRKMVLDKDLTFGPWAESAPSPVTGWLVAKEGVVLGRYNYDPADVREAPRRGDEHVIRAGNLTLAL